MTVLHDKPRWVRNLTHQSARKTTPRKEKAPPRRSLRQRPKKENPPTAQRFSSTQALMFGFPKVKIKFLWKLYSRKGINRQQIIKWIG
jgi:hypothetical protein